MLSLIFCSISLAEACNPVATVLLLIGDCIPSFTRSVSLVASRRAPFVVTTHGAQLFENPPTSPRIWLGIEARAFAGKVSVMSNIGVPAWRKCQHRLAQPQALNKYPQPITTQSICNDASNNSSNITKSQKALFEKVHLTCHHASNPLASRSQRIDTLYYSCRYTYKNMPYTCTYTYTWTYICRFTAAHTHIHIHITYMY